ncbi:MAG: transporter substrate-binding domain-containing protein, partial [Gammaproteobacteria bacterium]|nr:transporter substrate-binding domain-containing protein [Gammaproteobacteria bacterium]
MDGIRKDRITAGSEVQQFSSLFHVLILLMTVMFPLVGVSAEDDSIPASLTESERNWLAAHPTIRIGIMNAWPPMDYVDSSGMPQGIGVEFIRALNRRFGDRLEIVPGSWNENYTAAKEKRLDALMDITPRSDREPFFHFTKPYIEVPHIIYSRKDGSHMATLADLNGLTVGVERDFYIVNVLQEYYPQVSVREYTTTSDALDALSKREVNAYVGNRAGANYIIENELITNLKAQGKISETSSINAIGVRKDWPILRDILQKGLDDIDPTERMQLISPYPRIEQQEKVAVEFEQKLTSKEQGWLVQHPQIRLGVMDAWPPMSFLDTNGVPQGIGIDYLNAINKRLRGRLVMEPAPFKQNYEKVKNRQLDGIMDITPKPEREPFFEFTQPYMSIPHVFVGRRAGSYYDSSEDLNGHIVALEKGYYNVKFFRKKYPQVTVKEYPSTAEALGAVSRGEADAYAGNRVVAMYLIEQELLFNLAVQGRMDKPPVKLNIGVRKDWPILARIIDRAIADFTTEEIRQIHKQWVGELKKVELELTEEEKSWLNKRPIVRLGVDPDWPPIEWVDENGNYSGLSSEY